MKKLKLYGRNGDLESNIASVYVQNADLVVECRDAEVKKDVEQEIHRIKNNDQTALSKIEISNPEFLNVLKGLFNFDNEINPKLGQFIFEPNLSEVVDIIKEGGREKLRLYGEKEEFSGFVAKISVVGDEIIVEADDPKLKESLKREINEAISKYREFEFPWPQNLEFVHIDGFRSQKLGEPYFLRALKSQFWDNVGLGVRGKLGNRTFAGYKIKAFKSEIVVE